MSTRQLLLVGLIQIVLCFQSLAEPNLTKNAFRAIAGINIGPVRYLSALPARNTALENELTKLFALETFAEASYIYNDVELAQSKISTLVILTGPPAYVGDSFFAVLLDKSGKEYRLNQIFTDVMGPILISETITGGYRDIIYMTRAPTILRYRVFRYNGACYQFWAESGIVAPGTTLKGDVLFAGQSHKAIHFTPVNR